MGQVHFLPQGDIAYLRWIFTEESMQHRGIGTLVMKSLFSDLFAMGIRRFDTDTTLSNTVAQHYYKKMVSPVKESQEVIIPSKHRLSYDSRCSVYSTDFNASAILILSSLK